MLLGRFVIGPLLRSAVRTGSRDLIMAITLLILVAFALATGLAGLSVALGAFLAGLLISDSEARHQIEVDLEPFKGLLLGIFFITVGTNINPAVIVSDAGWIAGALVAMIAGKALILYAVARAFGVARAVAAEVALLLAQAGEFAFVVIGVAQAGNLLGERLAAGAVAVVGLSMMATPLIALAGRKLGIHLGGAEHLKHGPGPEAAGLDNHVIIGGFGRVGHLIAQTLDAEGVPYVALDTHGAMVGRERRGGQTVFFGDAGRTELLERVGARQARAFVVTVNNARAAERMVAAARSIRPDALVFARAIDASHAMRLSGLGAVAVVPETVEASLQLAARVLEGLDLPESAVSERISEMRSAELGRITKGGDTDGD
jgi:CPA2 family monovalent cation:H+ antiporter-2